MPTLASQIRTISGRHCNVLYVECEILNYLSALILFLLCVLLLKLAKVVILSVYFVIWMNPGKDQSW